MNETSLAFVFDTVEAAESAVRRLNAANVALGSFEVSGDLGRYGIPSIHAAGQCVLVLHLELAHDEAYVSELVRGSGRLIPVPDPQGEFLSLEVEGLRTANLWRSITEQTAPMAVAMAAGALSRLAPVYTVGAITGKRVEVQVNLLTHRFALGATQLRARQGDGVIEPLVVQRGDLHFALGVVKRAGLPFGFALLSAEVPKTLQPSKAQ